MRVGTEGEEVQTVVTAGDYHCPRFQLIMELAKGGYVFSPVLPGKYKVVASHGQSSFTQAS